MYQEMFRVGYKESGSYWGDEYTSLLEVIPNYDHDVISHYKALDLGCGQGRNISKMRSMGYQVDAVDIISADMLGLRQNHQKDVNFFCADAVDFVKSQASNSYDLIIAIHVFQNLKAEDRVQELACNITRLIKERGYICLAYFTEPVSDHPVLVQKNALFFPQYHLPSHYFNESLFETITHYNDLILDFHDKNTHYHRVEKVVLRRRSCSAIL